MNGAQWFNVVTSALCTLGALFFVTLYSKYAPWRNNEVGRQVMYLVFTIAAVLLYSVVVSFVPKHYLDWFRIGRGIGVAFVGWWLMRLGLMVWKLNRRQNDHQDG